MAKLDDFGRPIYETAEEYNRAHKGGVCPRPYDDPNGKNHKHNTVKLGKNSKTAVLGIVAFFLIVNGLIVFVMFNSMGFADFETGPVYQEEWVDTVEGYYIGTDEYPLTEGFERFYCNGNEYTLPTTYEEIKKIGLVDSSIEEYYEMFPADYEEIVALLDEDGYHYGDIRITNKMDEEVPVEKCEVDYIYLLNPEQFDGLNADVAFEFADGFDFDSTYEDLEDYFGIPYYVYEDYYDAGYDYDHYEWVYYGEEAYQSVSVIFCDDVIVYVTIENKTY